MAQLFQDRTDAGRRLADALADYRGDDTIVLAIPRGGVPVAYEVAERLHAQLDLIIPRKLPVPWNTEAGFGAVTAEGVVVLNDKMIAPLGLSQEQINVIADEVRSEIKRREREFRGNRPAPNLKGRTVIVVDDGIASGYTMLAAVKSVRMQEPGKVIAASPVASSSAVTLIKPSADQFVVLIESHQLPFAVANFYLNWYDLDDNEVRNYLNKAAAIG